MALTTPSGFASMSSVSRTTSLMRTARPASDGTERTGGGSFVVLVTAAAVVTSPRAGNAGTSRGSPDESPRGDNRPGTAVAPRSVRVRHPAAEDAAYAEHRGAESGACDEEPEEEE